jgi:hypothetical protein
MAGERIDKAIAAGDDAGQCTVAAKRSTQQSKSREREI